MVGRSFSVLAEGEGEITFQTFDDVSVEGKKRGDRSLAQIFHGSIEEHAAELAELNARGAGVYWMVNHGDGLGRRAENVTGVRALFVDLDGEPLGAVLTCGVEPHAVVESSAGKWHAYWLVDGCSLKDFRGAQLALANKFKGDTSVNDLPRVLRVPGFFHRKGKPVMVRLHEVDDTAQPYQFDDLARRLGLDLSAAAESEVQQQRAIDDGAPITEGSRHKHLERMFGRLNRAGLPDDMIEEAMQRENLARCSPPLDSADVAQTCRSMLAREEDAEASVHSVGFIMRELGWAA